VRTPPAQAGVADQAQFAARQVALVVLPTQFGTSRQNPDDQAHPGCAAHVVAVVAVLQGVVAPEQVPSGDQLQPGFAPQVADVE
jgi:hypothetical protein